MSSITRHVPPPCLFMKMSLNDSGSGPDSDRNVTSDSLDAVPGSNGRLNFFWEPMAAGKGGAENMAATVLIRVIHDCICSAFLPQRIRTDQLLSVEPQQHTASSQHQRQNYQRGSFCRQRHCFGAN